jgi:preprotein translocase subunit SecG
MTFRTYSIILSHILEQIPLNSQNSAEFDVKLLDVPFKYIQICSIIYLKKHKMRKRNLRLIFDPLFRFAESNDMVYEPGNGNQSNVRALPLQNLLKKSMLWLVPLFIFTSVALKAQSPQKINFQSIVRNTSGAIVSNKSVSFKITILSGSISGTPVYSEAHLSTTDAIGLVSLQIGTGTVSSGVFSSIDWGNTLHFIKLEADFNGGNTYVTLGIQELMSVPYALYAVKTDT